MSRKLLCLAAVLAIFALAGTVQAELIAYDGFDYSAGGLAGSNGGFGWAGTWTTSGSVLAQVNSTGLTWPTLTSEGGDATIVCTSSSTPNWGLAIWPRPLIAEPSISASSLKSIHWSYQVAALQRASISKPPPLIGRGQASSTTSPRTAGRRWNVQQPGAVLRPNPAWTRRAAPSSWSEKSISITTA